jgi:hypothetical protein
MALDASAATAAHQIAGRLIQASPRTQPLNPLVSEKFARMCERAVLTNRPSLELSPYRPKAIGA